MVHICLLVRGGSLLILRFVGQRHCPSICSQLGFRTFGALLILFPFCFSVLTEYIHDCKINLRIYVALPEWMIDTWEVYFKSSISRSYFVGVSYVRAFVLFFLFPWCLSFLSYQVVSFLQRPISTSILCVPFTWDQTNNNIT